MQSPDFWMAGNKSWQALLLSPAAALYSAVVRWKFSRTKSQRAQVPVICVGNLTLGGSGKTPIAAAITERLAAMGKKPFILMRGYGGRERGPIRVGARHTAQDVGDEALLHAALFPVVVANDRVMGAALAIREGADVIVMDDGLQNPSLEKTLSIVVIDRASGFGNGCVFPAGPLREHIADGLARADAVVLTGEGAIPPEALAAQLPVLETRLEMVNGADFAGKRVVAFAGIGRPDKFFASLRGCGADVIDAVPFADHFVYSSEALDRLKMRAASQNALLVTTEKDFMRMAPELRADITTLDVRAVFDDPMALDLALSRVFAGGTP